MVMVNFESEEALELAVQTWYLTSYSLNSCYARSNWEQKHIYLLTLLLLVMH